MRAFIKTILTVLVFAGLAGMTTIAAQAAGAIAIGKCDRYGYSYGSPSPAAARSNGTRNSSAAACNAASGHEPGWGSNA